MVFTQFRHIHCIFERWRWWTSIRHSPTTWKLRFFEAPTRRTTRAHRGCIWPNRRAILVVSGLQEIFGRAWFCVLPPQQLRFLLSHERSAVQTNHTRCPRHTCRWWHIGGGDAYYYMKVIGRLRDMYSFGVSLWGSWFLWNPIPSDEGRQYWNVPKKVCRTNRTRPNFETSTSKSGSVCARSAVLSSLRLSRPGQISVPKSDFSNRQFQEHALKTYWKPIEFCWRPKLIQWHFWLFPFLNLVLPFVVFRMLLLRQRRGYHLGRGQLFSRRMEIWPKINSQWFVQ